MPVIGATRFQQLFRAAAGLNVNKSDVRRYEDFLNRKLLDLFLMAMATAKWNGRDVIGPSDVPVSKGLQENIHDFGKLDTDGQLTQMLQHVVALPPLDMVLDEESEARIPGIAGGLSLALARTFPIVYPGVRNPGTEEWEVVFGVCDLLL
ncbi:MAG: DUF1931 family protein [Sciscionella sp.]